MLKVTQPLKMGNYEPLRQHWN